MIFRNKVLDIVKKIPKGKILTYKKVSELAGFPRVWRVVGNVLSKNKDLRPPKFLPAQISEKLVAGEKKILAGKKILCHRVIKSDGKLGGYNLGIKKKIALLMREGVKIENKRVIF